MIFVLLTFRKKGEIMLRRVHLDNFVKFKSPETIDFAEGQSPYIFVGENGSGKSSLLEGVRRCLSYTTSTTKSSVFDERRPSFYICKFDTSNCSDMNCGVMFTGIIRQETENTIYKFGSTRTQLLINRYYKDEKCSQFVEETTEFTKKFFCELESNKLDVNKIFERQYTEAEENELEIRLRALENYIILTFPSRSIGPLQWTKSKKITSDLQIKNYIEAGERAEILDYFLNNQTEFDVTLEQTIFGDLTGHSEVEFKMENDRINVRSRSSLLPGAQYALLKLPEGILEAKHFSILMSNKKFLTIVLEEPDRGMHPQMVERMLAVIQKQSDKLVILTTHNTSFVNPLTITRLVIFKHIEDHTETVLGNKIGNIKLPRMKNFPEGTLSMITLRTVTKDHLADLLFAKRILFCEGDSDYLFLSALKEKVMKRAGSIEYVFGNILKDHSIDILQKVCVSLQIISMAGWSNAELMHKLCSNDYLKLDDHYFVCDKDAILTGEDKEVNSCNSWIAPKQDDFRSVQKSYKTNITNADKVYNDKFKKPGTDLSCELREFKNVVDDNWDVVRKYLRDSCKCFSWKDGTIEDMVISLLRCEMPEKEPDPEESHKKYKYDKELILKEKRTAVNELKRQNVDLPYERWKVRRPLREDKDKKLFLSPKITPENIAESMEILLNACRDEKDDLIQFILFLLKMENT